MTIFTKKVKDEIRKRFRKFYGEPTIFYFHPDAYKVYKKLGFFKTMKEIEDEKKR